MIKLFIPILPMGAVRTTQKQKFVDKRAIKYYTYKQEIALLVKQHVHIPSEKPILADITFYMPIPNNGKSKGKKVKEGQFHASTKDLDNLIKGLLDALNGITFADDRQICQIYSKKVYSCNPGIAFELWEVDEMEENNG